MDNIIILPFIQLLQSLPAEIVSLILFGTCAVSILFLFRLFGAPGLYLFNIVAIIASNIQVLKNVQFSLCAEPVALGTVVFASTYLCSDILTEHYGKASAKIGIWYCFAAQLLMTVLMIIAVGYPPLASQTIGAVTGATGNLGAFASAGGLESMISTEKAMSLLFTPSPRLMFASLLAFAISQFNDIWLFQALNTLTRGKLLWLRTSVSSLVSAMVDTVLFSALAWVILSPDPVSLSTLIFTYILGTFVARAWVSVLSTPIMYFSYTFRPQSLKAAQNIAEKATQQDLRPKYVR